MSMKKFTSGVEGNNAELVFEHVKYRPWNNTNVGSGYKASFTRNRNEYLKG